MDMNGTSDPYVVFTLQNKSGQQVQQINSKFKKATLNPVWNECFTFDISSKDEYLVVEVYDKDTFGNDDFEGQFRVELELPENSDKLLPEDIEDYEEKDKLFDQMKHDIWFDLLHKTGNKYEGRVRLMLQWIYSKEQYFGRFVREWDRAIAENIVEKNQVEKYLASLESPFGFLDQVKRDAVDAGEDSEDDGQNVAKK